MIIPDWAKELNCSITVCDKDGVIIYQNDPAVRQYEKHGNLIGKNLFGCHGERSAGIIRHLLETAARTATPSRSKVYTNSSSRAPGRKTAR